MVGRIGSFQPPGTPATVLAAGVQQLGLATPQRSRLPRPNLPRTPSTRQSTRRSTARRDVYRIPAALMRLIEQGMPTGPQPLVPSVNETGAAAAPVQAAAATPQLATAAPVQVAATAPGLAAATTPQLAAAAVPGPPPPPTAAGFPQAPCYECGVPTHRARDCPRRQTRIQHGAVCKPWRDSRGGRGGRGGGRGWGSRGASAEKPEGRSQGSGQTIVYNFQHYF